MKFSIRDLLLVTVIVALAVGWWVDHRIAWHRSVIWRNRAGGLNWIMSMEGWKTEWWEERVFAEKEGSGAYDAPTDIYAPDWPVLPP
jgi:hypothetical protein